MFKKRVSASPRLQKGGGGMGNHKHGTSGATSKSPAVRMRMKLDAERKDQQKAPPPRMFETPQEAFRAMRRKT